MQEHGSRPRPGRLSAVAAAVSAGLLASACAGLGGIGGLGPSAQLAPAAEAGQAASHKSELDKAIQYWGKQHAQNPRDLKAALAYAKNLKANGQKKEAFAVLQAVSLYHGDNRELAGEYGRLALDQGQVQIAQKLLAAADDPANPDWRIISARGTALAKQGSYAEAVPFYERALKLKPDQPSLLNNLALAYAAEGQAAKAEPILRRASEQQDADPKVRQNLALVLGLQGKYGEATEVAARDLTQETASADVDYLRKIVRLEPKSTGGTALAQAPAPAKTKQPAPALRKGSEGTAIAAPADAWTPRVAQSR